MIATVFIEPHERAEALEAYASWLSPEQKERIEDAPDGALVRLDKSGETVTLVIIEEG